MNGEVINACVQICFGCPDDSRHHNKGPRISSPWRDSHYPGHLGQIYTSLRGLQDHTACLTDELQG